MAAIGYDTEEMRCYIGTLYIMDGDILEESWVLSCSINDLYRTPDNGLRCNLKELIVNIRREGKKTDYSMLFDYPVVSARTADLIDKCAPNEVERIPLRFATAAGSFELIHVLWSVDCLDRNKSTISPDGMIWKTVINEQKTMGRRIFRLFNTSRIIVEGCIREEFLKNDVTGVVFEKVYAD